MCFDYLHASAVCCLTSIAIEWAYFQNWFDVRKKFAMWEENEMIRRGADREQRDLHSAAINGILSGLVAITAGETTKMWCGSCGVLYFPQRTFVP